MSESSRPNKEAAIEQTAIDEVSNEQAPAENPFSTKEEDQEGQANSTPTPWKALFAFSTKRHAFYLIVAIAFAIITGVIVPVLAFILGQVLNDFTSFGKGDIVGSNLASGVTANMSFLVMLGGGSWVSNSMFFWIWMSFGEAQAKNARVSVYRAMMAKDISWYETQTAGSGAIVARIQTQIRDLQIATAQPLGLVIQHLATFLAALGLAFWSAPDVSGVTLAAMPLGVVALACFSAKMQSHIDGQSERLTTASQLVKSAIDAIEIVKCFNAKDFEIDKYRDIISIARRYAENIGLWNAIQVGTVRFLSRILFVAGFWYGSHVVSTGDKKSGQILTAFWACLMATQVFEQILPQLVVLEKGRTAGAALSKFVAANTAVKPILDPGCFQPDFWDENIEFDEVHFAYPSKPNQQSLQDVSLLFGAGDTTWVVGRSGSGKSTIAALLTRFYDTWKGRISFGPYQLEDIDPTWLRKHVTIVQQDSVLFNDTLLANIELGRQSDQALEPTPRSTAIEMACLEQTLDDLLNGLNTIIGPGGTLLSGGQTQRVALARARLRDTPVLILDEVTSALDKATGDAVMQAILKWRVGKTTVIITHDLEHVRPEDYVYVLDQAKVVEHGYRNALEDASQNDVFLRLLQSAGSEPKSPPSSPSKSMHSRTGSGFAFPRSRRDTHTFSQATTAADLISLSSPTGNPLKLLPSPAQVHVRDSVASMLDRRGSGISMLSGSTANFHGMRSSAGSIFGTPRLGVAVSLKKPREDTNDNSTSPVSPRSSVALNIHQIKEARDRLSRRHSGFEMDAVSGNTHAKTRTTDRKATCTSSANAPLPMWRILATVWPGLSTTKEKLLLVVAFVLGTIHAACTPGFSWIFARLMATFYSPGDAATTAMQWSLALGGLAFVDAFCAFGLHFLLGRCAEIWVEKIRLEALKRILNQPKSWFESTDADISQILNHLDRGAEEMKFLLSRFAGLMWVALVMMVVGVIWALKTSWQLTLTGLASMLVVYLVTWGFDKVSAVWEGKISRASEAAASIFSETFEKIKTIRSLTLESVFSRKYESAAAAAQSVGTGRARWAGVFFGVSDASIIFATALIFWYGSQLVVQKAYSVTSITTVLTMLLFVISNVNALVGFMPQLSSSRETATSLLRLTQLRSLDSHENYGFYKITESELQGAIRFRQARFSYPSRPEVLALDKLDIDIPLHSSTALVGLSGSGKSTIVSLILRLHGLHNTNTESDYASNFLTSQNSYSPGSVKVGDSSRGINLNQLDINHWRSLVAYVPQQSKVFPGTVTDNIAYGLPEASRFRDRQQIILAASQAGIHQFILSLPNQYETMIGEGGVGLSGGQRQKLGIARAMIRQPKILVMDEPTSALDATSAAEIRELIRKQVAFQGLSKPAVLPGQPNRHGLTVVVVTHSVEMMKTCEKVYVLEAGKTKDQGTFAELMQRRALRMVLGGSREAATV